METWNPDPVPYGRPPPLTLHFPPKMHQFRTKMHQIRKNAYFPGLSRCDIVSHRFCVRFSTIFEGFWQSKNEEKCGRVCLFLSFGPSKIEGELGSIFEGSGASFSEGFRGWQTALMENIDFFMFFFGICFSYFWREFPSPWHKTFGCRGRPGRTFIWTTLCSLLGRSRASFSEGFGGSDTVFSRTRPNCQCS